MKIAVIGTAGRDKNQPLTKKLWAWMVADLKARLPMNEHLISGGAAWADHLAVQLFLEGHCAELTLFLPAPFDPTLNKFLGPRQSAGNAANYYHELFSKVIGIDTRAQIARAALREQCHGGWEPAAEGYQAMFTRNRKVAKEAVDGMIAYTFGNDPKMPLDGGTKDTWNRHVQMHPNASRVHVPMPSAL